jgi:hypothetical protein
MDSTTTGNHDGSTLGLDTNKTVHKMEKGLKVWQAIVSFVLLLITVVSLIVNQSNKIETQGLRINYLESAQRDNALLLKEMNGKLTEILIELQNKEDRGKQ